MRARTTLSLSFLGFVGAGSAAALGTYLLFNPRLRKQMMASDSAIEAMELFGSSVKKDALETADQTMEAMHKSWITKQLRQARSTLGRRFSRAKHHVKHHAKHHAKEMKHEMNETAREVGGEAHGAAHDLSAQAEKATR